MRSNQWKLVEQYEDGSAELYDLAADPAERTDLAGREPAKVRELRDLLARWRRDVGAQMNEQNPAFDASLHRPLYVALDPSRYDPAESSVSV